MRRCLLFLLYWSFASPLLRPDGPPFDLYGPKVDLHVKRGDVTLPASETPNLIPGDRLWIHPDLPDSQATHFVLVVAFLRGSTNPPPSGWFTRVETWTHDVHNEGVFVTVPAEAQQALLFLAPETGGDFNTLRKAVRDEPGSFVRAAQDLEAASWERMRLETYLSDVKVTSQYDPTALKTRAELAARSLGIKINESCFARPADQQASCLSQNSEGMVLDDANAQSLVSQLTTGSALDLVNQLSASSMGGGGVYSPYVGAIIDTAKILSSLHTAHFQYIPALALPTADSLNLRLNMPPSFSNPKSVVVVALPPIGPSKPEPLNPVGPGQSLCALKPGLVLPAEGAPLLFATQLAHDLVLHIESGGAQSQHAVDVPLKADPAGGGLVPAQPLPPLPAGELTGIVRGKWGFDDWNGPAFQLFSPQQGQWTVASSDRTALVVGREDTFHLDGQSTVCVEKVEVQAASGQSVSLPWKPLKPATLEVSVPLKNASPGPVDIAVYQYGETKPDRLTMVAYDAAASLDRLTICSGDASALLKGSRLDQVAKAQIGGIAFTPGALDRVGNADRLAMIAAEATSSLESGKPYTARVSLKDGRILDAPVTVMPPRPQVTLLGKGVQIDAATPLIKLGSQDDLPAAGRLVFFLRSGVPPAFPRDEKIEFAAADASFHSMLSLSDGSLMLEDADTAVASLEPLAHFGPSAFGPVRIRPVSADGAAGDWLPLGTLVRLPGFAELRCPRSASKPCLLSGSNLFLAESFSSSPAFDDPTDVAPELTDTEIVVPHPSNGVLYLKLRDDPTTVQMLTLPVTPIVQAATLPARKLMPIPAPSEAPPSSPPAAQPSPPIAPPPAAPQPNNAPPANAPPSGQSYETSSPFSAGPHTPPSELET